MTTTTLTFSPEPSAPTSPKFGASLSPYACASPSISPWRRPGRSSSIALPSPTNVITPTFTVTAPQSPSPSPSPAPSPPQPQFLGENDILSSPLIPLDHKPTIIDRHQQLTFVLSTQDRTGHGFDAAGSSHADKLVAAEQLASMSLVYDWNVAFHETRGRTWEENDEECESMATAMLDAGFCASGWSGTWDQPCFVTPLCLLGREQEIAELASRCVGWFAEQANKDSLGRVGEQRGRSPLSGETSSAEELDADRRKTLIARRRASSSLAQQEEVLSADTILEFWQRPLKPAIEVLLAPTRPHVRDLKIDNHWLKLQQPGKCCIRAVDDIFHAAAMRSAQGEDLDHGVWTNCTTAQPVSPSRELELEWPPAESLEGCCLIEKLVHREICDIVSFAEETWENRSRILRRWLHPWCLRCYRIRCQSRRRTTSTAILDACFMWIGILIVIAVEAYIAWTDERALQAATFSQRVAMARSLFLEHDVREVPYHDRKPEPSEAKQRHRSISCLF